MTSNFAVSPTGLLCELFKARFRLFREPLQVFVSRTMRAGSEDTGRQTDRRI